MAVSALQQRVQSQNACANWPPSRTSLQRSTIIQACGEQEANRHMECTEVYAFKKTAGRQALPNSIKSMPSGWSCLCTSAQPFLCTHLRAACSPAACCRALKPSSNRTSTCAAGGSLKKQPSATYDGLFAGSRESCEQCTFTCKPIQHMFQTASWLF